MGESEFVIIAFNIVGLAHRTMEKHRVGIFGTGLPGRFIARVDATRATPA